MMVESSSLQLPPPAVGHKLIYIEKLILYDIIVIYIAQHFVFFFVTFLRHSEGENTGEKIEEERIRARVRCS